jgi:hypothetical protein
MPNHLSIRNIRTSNTMIASFLEPTGRCVKLRLQPCVVLRTCVWLVGKARFGRFHSTEFQNRNDNPTAI